jgi:hypothetical protein
MGMTTRQETAPVPAPKALRVRSKIRAGALII